MLGGSRENKIFEPSKGGIGIRLKTANMRFIKTIIVAIKTKPLPNEASIQTLEGSQQSQFFLVHL